MSKWPRYPTIYEVDTWVWLFDLSENAGISVDLSCVPLGVSQASRSAVPRKTRRVDYGRMDYRERPSLQTVLRVGPEFDCHLG